MTRPIVNADLLPTASFVIDPDIDFEAGAMQNSLDEAVGDQISTSSTRPVSPPR